MVSSILYSLGILVYRKAWKESGKETPMFTNSEKIIAITLVLLGIASLVIMIMGALPVENYIHWFKHHKVGVGKI